MSFSSVGDFRTVLQKYKYGSHTIYCVFQIIPDKVSYYGREPENDFNWMTGTRWTKLESSLWRIFANCANWEHDAVRLNTEILVDHIQVTIRATEELLWTAQTLLKTEASTKNDLALEIVLKYMSHDDATILTAHATKRKHEVEAKTTKQTDNSSQPEKSSSSASIKNKLISKSSDSDKVKRVKLQKNDDPEPSTSRKRSAETETRRNRERRSISHDSSHQREKSTLSKKQKRTSHERSRSPRSFKSPVSSQSPDADGPKPEHRTASSPKQNSCNSDNFVGRSIKPSKSSRSETSEDLSSDQKGTRSTRREQRTKKPTGSATKDSKNGSESADADKKSSNRNPSSKSKAGSSTTVANKDNELDKKSISWQLEQFSNDCLNSEELKKINDILEVPKPRKVKILLLKDMNEANVLDTFEKYREDFDRLFKERQHKFQTISYMTIDHCHIMDILNKTIRENMIKKLGEVYSKSGPHGSLVINGLLPLWVIRLFMDRYKFTQDEAVRQIADQLKYNTYLKAVNNDPLSSDLEE